MSNIIDDLKALDSSKITDASLKEKHAAALELEGEKDLLSEDETNHLRKLKEVIEDNIAKSTPESKPSVEATPNTEDASNGASSKNNPEEEENSQVVSGIEESPKSAEELPVPPTAKRKYKKTKPEKNPAILEELTLPHTAIFESENFDGRRLSGELRRKYSSLKLQLGRVQVQPSDKMKRLVERLSTEFVEEYEKFNNEAPEEKELHTPSNPSSHASTPNPSSESKKLINEAEKAVAEQKNLNNPPTSPPPPKKEEDNEYINTILGW